MNDFLSIIWIIVGTCIGGYGLYCAFSPFLKSKHTLLSLPLKKRLRVSYLGVYNGK
jgi:hypothetical protein